jgi:hypothetical protein
VTYVFGAEDWALRIPSYVAGFGLIVLAALLAQKVVQSFGAKLALIAIISLSPTLIYYTSEFKQYGFEAFVSAGLMLAFADRDDRCGLQWLAGLCFFAPIFSAPATFLVVTIVGWMALEAYLKSTPRLFIAVAIPAILGIAFFLAYNFSAGTDRALPPKMIAWWSWKNGFAPFPPRSSLDLSWYWDALAKLADLAFRHVSAAVPTPLFFINSWLGISLALGVGSSFLLALFSRRPVAIVAVGTIACALLASIPKFYPFAARLTVFSLPLVAIIVATAVDMVAVRLGQIASVALGAAAVLVLAQPAMTYVRNPPELSDVKGAIYFINAQSKPDDAVATYYPSIVFKAYQDKIANAQQRAFARLPRAVTPDMVFSELKGAKRAWLLVAKTDDGSIKLLKELPTRYRLLKEWQNYRTRAVLFELTQPAQR